jgi:MarR family
MSQGTMDGPGGRDGSWTLLTGHGHVLVEIARNPQARIRDLAEVAGITERTVQAIVTDLETAGYIARSRDGRRTRYTVNPDNLFRHPAQGGHRVGPFLALLADTGDAPRGPLADGTRADGRRSRSGTPAVADRPGDPADHLA